MQQVTQKNQSNLITQDRPDSSGPNSAPRPITHTSLTFHTLAGSTSSISRDPGLMVNVPQSEAPSPRNERPGNDE